MVGLIRGRAPWLCTCVGALALALSACASTAARSGSTVTVTGSTLDVYAAAPPGPPDQVTKDVLAAEGLALKQAGGKAGGFEVRLRMPAGDEVSANARAAVAAQQTIAYLGEIAPGTSGVSVQITNQVGLLQISPTDTAVYLTQSTPAVSDSPDHYYPSAATFHRTFARVVPNTAQEAKALVADMRALHVTKLYVSNDATPYGASVAGEVSQDARSQGITLTSGATGADGVFYGAVDGPHARRALDGVAASDPNAKLFAASALYDENFVASLSPAAQRNLYVTSPGLPLRGQSSGAKAFAAAFRSTYGRAPQPQAIYGYEAMSALIAVLKGLGVHANSRARVVSSFRGLKDRQSALGTYSLTQGDTNVASFVIAHPAGGKLVPRSNP